MAIIAIAAMVIVGTPETPDVSTFGVKAIHDLIIAIRAIRVGS